MSFFSNMKNIFLTLTLALACQFLLGLTLSQDAAAQATKVKKNHGAWQVNCGRPPGSKTERCAAVQSVTAEDRPNVGLTVILLKSRDGSKRLLRVVAPLGVLLPAGLGLKVDNVDIGHVKFIKCGKIGCIAEATLNAKEIGKLTNGKNAVFIFFQTPEAGIGIPISLQGFSSALASIQ